MLSLVEPSVRYQVSFLAAEREFSQHGGERVAVGHAALISDFPRYVERLLTEQGRPPAEPGRVPGTVLWLVDGDTYAGRVSLRHRLTPRLRRRGGHIGYEIRPSLRRRGYEGLIDLEVERDEVNITTVRGVFMIDGQTGYIKLGDFSETSDDEVGKALKDLTAKGMKRLVLDLRDHQETWVQQKLGDRWLGFGEGTLRDLLTGAGFRDVVVNIGARRAGDPFTVIVARGEKIGGRKNRR